MLNSRGTRWRLLVWFEDYSRAAMACILCVQTLFAQTNACVQELGPANTSQVAYSMYFGVYSRICG